MKLYQAFYSIVKFIPNLVKEEPINIGLIIHSPESGYIKTEFSEEKANIISRYNSDIDPLTVELIIKDIKENFDNEKYIFRNQKIGTFYDDKLLYNVFATHSNQLQITKPKALVTDNLEAEFERLFSELVYKDIRVRRIRAIEERTMKSNIKKRFNKFGLIDKAIVKADPYEIGKYGDRINLDFEYLNGKTNLVKNISLDIKSVDPLDHAKLWLKNYEIIKDNSKDQGVEKNIQVIYCLPEFSEMNTGMMSCLYEGSDELIDYRDNEKIDFFVNRVAEVAHN